MKLILVLAIVILLGLLLGFLFYNGRIRFNYPNKDEFPLLGIDISHHQGKVRWEELRTEKISFVIIKATEGADYKDSKFTDNWAASKKENYKTGAYHFYRLCKVGKEQAENFISVVPRGDENLPPAVDLEFGGNCKTSKSKVETLAEIQEFLKILEDHYQKKPIIYATNEFYEEFLLNEFKEYPIWIRNIYKRPKLEEGRNWFIWQFANRGHLHGIHGFVDLNVIHGKSMEILQ